MLLGMPDVNMFKLQSVDCNTMEPSWKSKQINEQPTQDKSYVNKNMKENVTIKGKYKNKIDYFIAELDKGDGSESKH